MHHLFFSHLSGGGWFYLSWTNWDTGSGKVSPQSHTGNRKLWWDLNQDCLSPSAGSPMIYSVHGAQTLEGESEPISLRFVTKVSMQTSKCCL